MIKPNLPLLVSAVLTLAACKGRVETTALPATDDSTAIRLAVMPVLDCLPFYYAEQEGLFDSVGLKVRLKTFRAAMDADTAFRGTTADAICTDLVKACIWRSGGDSVKAVMATRLDLYLLTAYSARIRQTASLKEKIIGITRNSAVDLVTDEILSQAKLLSTDLNKPQINNVELRCYMVDQNQYDGALLPEPYASECEARGARRIAGTPELGLKLGVLVVRDSLARRSKDISLLRQAYDLAASQLNERLAKRAATPADTSLLAITDQPVWEPMQYFPQEFRLNMPDSLVAYPTFTTAGQVTEAEFNRVKNWCKGRDLLRRDFGLQELMP